MKFLSLLAACGALAAATLHAGPSQRVAAALWGEGELFDTVATDTEFKSPPAHSTDLLYNFGESQLSGQRSVAESAPGSPGYNGGRWSVVLVYYTDAGLDYFDMNGDGMVDEELTSYAEVQMAIAMGLLETEHSGVYFECPMLPRRGRN